MGNFSLLFPKLLPLYCHAIHLHSSVIFECYTHFKYWLSTHSSIHRTPHIAVAAVVLGQTGCSAIYHMTVTSPFLMQQTVSGLYCLICLQDSKLCCIVTIDSSCTRPGTLECLRGTLS